MDEEIATPEAIKKLDVQTTFQLIEFYENAASVVKNRTWTITTWVLTINSALIAFSFQLYTDHLQLAGFLWIQAAICLVGLALCTFLYFLIQDQGNHLSHYWTNENKIGAMNSGIQDLVLDKEDPKVILAPGYRADTPKFCKRLVILAQMFAVGFVGLFLLILFLVSATPN